MITVGIDAAQIEKIAERAAVIVLGRIRSTGATFPYFTIEEAAEYLRCNPQRVYDLLSQRRLSRFKDGRRTLVSRAELERHVEGHS